ncbi:MAG: hypothetical protein GY913_11250 [Proteobacteria bacterium]|nr:hypothetical protein [Pseudomonadota bacterium]MCP4917490.1 hypothetical protein [Pseudomonadota bacterium]
MAKAFDFHDVPEDQKLAFYGTLFAMAAADGHTAHEELELIFESIDTRELSDSSVSELRAFMETPPDLDPLLEKLAEGSDDLRFGVLMHLTDVALADERFKLGEKRALRRARQVLHISREQGLAIEEFVWEVREIREQGLDEQATAQALAKASDDLWSHGVPKSAVGFSGSVVGLSATGALAGAAAIGLGLGLIPGLGVAVAIGTATFVALNWVFNSGKDDERVQDMLKTQKQRAERLKENLGRLGEILEKHH